MTIGVMWEFFEYGVDSVLNKDMQKDKVVTEISTVNLEPSGRNIPVVINNIEKTIIQSRDKNGNIQEYIVDDGFLDIGLHDTMEDLIVNFIGATVFSIFGFLYIENRDKYKFLENFIMKRKREKRI